MARRSTTQRRISEIIHELCRMGRDGWRGYTAADWQPLEAELRRLTEGR